VTLWLIGIIGTLGHFERTGGEELDDAYTGLGVIG
jgi:hypothetical protein